MLTLSKADLKTFVDELFAAVEARVKLPGAVYVLKAVNEIVDAKLLDAVYDALAAKGVIVAPAA